jgi:uncharacterized protein YjiS (DUF1127 family)
MSCGTTTCTSTAYELPASKPFSGFEWLGRSSLALLISIDRGWERRHQRRQLLGLDDRLLADIGISRQQAAEEACKSCWIRVTMWRVYR